MSVHSSVAICKIKCEMLPQEKWRQMYEYALNKHQHDDDVLIFSLVNNWKGFMQCNFYKKCVCRVSFTQIKPLVVCHGIASNDFNNSIIIARWYALVPLFVRMRY